MHKSLRLAHIQRQRRHVFVKQTCVHTINRTFYSGVVFYLSACAVSLPAANPITNVWFQFALFTFHPALLFFCSSCDAYTYDIATGQWRGSSDVLHFISSIFPPAYVRFLLFLGCFFGFFLSFLYIIYRFWIVEGDSGVLHFISSVCIPGYVR